MPDERHEKSIYYNIGMIEVRSSDDVTKVPNIGQSTHFKLLAKGRICWGREL